MVQATAISSRVLPARRGHFPSTVANIVLNQLDWAQSSPDRVFNMTGTPTTSIVLTRSDRHAQEALELVEDEELRRPFSYSLSRSGRRPGSRALLWKEGL